MKLAPISRSAPERLFRYALVVVAIGCQEVFGGFEETPEPAPTSPVASGGSVGSGGSGASPSGGQLQSGCPVDQAECDGEVLRSCVDGVWLEERCSSEAHCDDVNVECRECVEGEQRCLDRKTPEGCDAANGRWVTGPACEAFHTCDEALGTCVRCKVDISVCASDTVLCRCKSDQSDYEPLTCPDRCLPMGLQDDCSGGEGAAGAPAGVCDNIE
jgi:hypothetical protein